MAPRIFGTDLREDERAFLYSVAPSHNALHTCKHRRVVRGTSGRTFKAGQSTLRKRHLFVRYTGCVAKYD